MKKVIKTIIIVFVSLMIGIFVDKMFFINKKEDLSTEKNIQKKNIRALSMMLETGAGTGVYEMTTRSTWPTEGYLFNEELSKCENGGNLSWNDENNTVVMTGSTSDKCYVYFDIYNLAEINSITEETTSSSIKLTVSATEGTSSIVKYYYSKDNGTTYTESTSNTYTFTGLTKDTTYNIKVYALDETGKYSAVYSKSIKTDNTQMLADYVRSLYTTQGFNGIYLHNGTIKEGETVIDANDDSYRYAGANPNNYVCFGSDAIPCPNDNLYRIIGVFEDRVKLIKSDYATSTQLGTTGAYWGTSLSSAYSTYRGSLSELYTFFWNNSSNTNTWSESNLNATNLNGTYLTNLGVFANKIAESTWKVGGNPSNMIMYSAMNTAYQNEIVFPSANTTYSAKIGLMYVSDYGYAASPTYWRYRGYSSDGATYDYRAAKNENWMYMGLPEWTISRATENSRFAFYLHDAGNVKSDAVTIAIGVRPCFYLNSNVTYSSGTGEKNSPIRLN